MLFLTRLRENDMDMRDDTTMKEAIFLGPTSVKPGVPSFGKKMMHWLAICGITGVIIFYITQSLTQEPSLSFFVCALASVSIVGSIWSHWIATARHEQRVAFIDAYQFPARVKERVGRHYPHLSDDQLSLIMHGLRQYLQFCNTSIHETVSMPSRAVDTAWHEFILFTRDYNQFCERGIGRFLHHLPAEGTISPGMIEDGLRKAWLLACEWEGIDQKSPCRLPFLFAIDAALNIPDGFPHSLDNDYATKDGTACGSGGCGGCGGGC